MKDRTIITTVAILSISVLESLALMKGVDGVFFVPVVALISGLAGYEFRLLKES